jgi:hypothetical protein
VPKVSTLCPGGAPNLPPPIAHSEALERHAGHGVEGTVALALAFGDVDVHDAAVHGVVDASHGMARTCQHDPYQARDSTLHRIVRVDVDDRVVVYEHVVENLVLTREFRGIFHARIRAWKIPLGCSERHLPLEPMLPVVLGVTHSD